MNDSATSVGGHITPAFLLLACACAGAQPEPSAAKAPAPAATPTTEMASVEAPQEEPVVRVPYAPPANTLASCAPDDTHNVLLSLVPSVFDYVELRTADSLSPHKLRNGEVTDPEAILGILKRKEEAPLADRVRLAAGEPCKGAKDNATCMKALEARLRLAGPSSFPDDLEIVATKGDKILSFVSLGRLVKALQPIDSADKASLVALAAGYSLGRCGKQQPKANGKEFELTTELEWKPTDTGCRPDMVSTRLVSIDEGGTVRAKSTTKPAPRKESFGSCTDRLGPPPPEPKPQDTCPENATCAALP